MDRAGSGIRFVCSSHALGTPIVTLHEQQWAYCQGGYVAAQGGHVWTAISPAKVSELKWKQVGFIREGLSLTT
jgi:hypothetical protein